VQVAVPVMITTGWPSDITRTAPAVHFAVTHGPLPVGATSGHADTRYGAAMVTIAMFDTITRVLISVGDACPPWKQRI